MASCIHAITRTYQAECGFFEGKPPEEWPSNHVYALSQEDVNCAECRKILDARERIAQQGMREESLVELPGGDPCW